MTGLFLCLFVSCLFVCNCNYIKQFFHRQVWSDRSSGMTGRCCSMYYTTTPIIYTCELYACDVAIAAINKPFTPPLYCSAKHKTKMPPILVKQKELQQKFRPLFASKREFVFTGFLQWEFSIQPFCRYINQRNPLR